ncbi:DUF397 domain-containing protein [Spirillospora sp. NPDC049652]
MILWRKSSHSESGAGGSCIELADLGGTVGVRDSRDPHGARLVLRREDLRALVGTIVRE